MVRFIMILATVMVSNSKIAFGADCTNFSGFWKGTCVSGANRDPSFLAWEQLGCKTIMDGTTPRPIGGITTASWSTDDSMVTRTEGLDWDKDKKTLKGHTSLVRRTYGSPKFLMEGSAAVTVEKMHSQLKITTKGDFIVIRSGVEVIVSGDMVCTYNKE